MGDCFRDGDSCSFESFAERSPWPPNHTMLSAFDEAFAAALQRISPAISATCASAIRTTFRQKRTLLGISAGYDEQVRRRTKSGVKFATANPSCDGPPHSKARFARESFGESSWNSSHFDSALVAMPTLVIPAPCNASITPINFCTGKSRSGRITIAISGFVCFNCTNWVVRVSRFIT
jgi:hypothetical protein